jgi:predicted DNA-binding transcriptional regulator YafY
MTRRAVVPVQERTLRLARALYAGETVSAHWIACTFGVDRRTARRDLDAIACYLPVRRLPLVGRGEKRVRLA